MLRQARAVNGMAPAWSPRGGLWPSESTRIRRIIRFNAHSIVDGKAQFLLAAEVAFRRLDRDMSEQKLDKMAEPSATPPQIMRRQFLDSGTRGRGADNLPQHLERHTRSPDPASPVDRAKECAFGDVSGFLPFIDCKLHP